MRGTGATGCVACATLLLHDPSVRKYTVCKHSTHRSTSCTGLVFLVPPHREPFECRHASVLAFCP